MREEIKKKIVEHLINDELVDKISQPPSFMLKPRPRVEDGEPDPDKERILELKEKCARCGKKRTTKEYPVIEQRRLHHTKTGYNDYLPSLSGYVCHGCASTTNKAMKLLQKKIEQEQEEMEKEQEKHMEMVKVRCSDCKSVHTLNSPCDICNCETIQGMKMALVEEQDVAVIEIPTDRFKEFIEFLRETETEIGEEFVAIGESLEER